jgi:hypothetical protein
MSSLGSYLTVSALCAVKYMIGVASGLATNFSFIELFLCYFIGGSLGMVLYTLFGNKIMKWWKSRKSQNLTIENNLPTEEDWKRKVWNKFGLIGIAIITPPILSQPVGTAISLGFGTPAYKVIIAMCSSMLLWSLIFAYAGNTIMQWF